MRQLMSAAVKVMVAASVVTGVMLVSAGSASAQASCTGALTLVNQGGYYVAVPATDSESDDCELGVGNDSFAVELLQGDLNACYGQRLTVDGIYGPLTEAAVEVAQRDSGAAVDGIYGPQTRDDIKWVDAYEPTNPHTCYKL